MQLKILLPYRVLVEEEEVLRIVAETSEGFFGILPQRLDCVAALVPGILTYETRAKGVCYLAIDEGTLVKTEAQVLVSTRNAIAGASLEILRQTVETEFIRLSESENSVRAVLTKMESGLIFSLQKLLKEKR